MASVVTAVCELVERASGKPVIVLPDPAMPLVARVTVARGTTPAHVVHFNPSRSEGTDYPVVFQCGFILRMYHTAPDKRFEVTSTHAGRREADDLTKAHFKKVGMNLPAAAREQVARQLYDGLVLQLRSVPLGLRVDAWIARTYPELQGEQERSARRQMAEYQAALAPRIKGLAPEKVYRANVGMNAAFAAFWGRALPDPNALLPYRLAGYERDGQELLKVADGLPDEPDTDRDLMQAWASLLGLGGWIEFAAFGG